MSDSIRALSYSTPRLPSRQATGKRSDASDEVARIKNRETFGHETRSRHKAFLVKRIVWRPQALAEGDLSERAGVAEELADDADSAEASRSPRRLATGRRAGGPHGDGRPSSVRRLPAADAGAGPRGE